ncbi:hypothetical protein [Saccharomonospora glauca]|uniref:Uncharacterized protein n=1 Tax=Saccharomonospora glauca K62 TaxID=928724 RepID=I1D6E1_9PSEU|nr:hypothetical protein [Saccharomonospora glauca]EIF00516.1 hypothetical protein SacglDRAFT_03663 [Saccharomonospora glauca K62]
MTRRTFVAKRPILLIALLCLVVLGWSAWTGGLFDDEVESHVRASSFYAAPEVDVDREAAERIIGDRKLVVIMLEPGADKDVLDARCDGDWNAAANTLMLVLSQHDDEYENWACSHFPGAYDENLGKSFAAENMIARGIDQFVDRPLDALKVVVVNYDLLVGSGVLPDGSREINAPIGRYVIAGATLLAVVVGTTAAYVGARRAGRAAARRAAQREATGDARSRLSAAAAHLAQQIIDLDRLYDGMLPSQRRKFESRYRSVAARYTRLGERAGRSDLDEREANQLTAQFEELSRRCRELERTATR